MRPTRRGLLVLAPVVAVAGCARDASPGSSPTGATTGSSPVASPAPTSSVPSSPTGSSAPGSSAPGASSAQPSSPGELPLEVQVGQLLMVGHDRPTLDPATRDLFSRHQIGSMLLLGNALGGRSGIAALTSQLAGLDLAVPLVVAADQEGGRVQRLSGSGFSTIPTAVEQAKLGPRALEERWRGWGGELARAGVHYNLAPVADLVPPDYVSRNAPIGQLQRNYGTDAQTVAASTSAVVAGLRAAGVASALKHFPGLGRVTVNTDFGVAVDEVTTGTDAELAPFVAAIKAGASSVMVSSAIYRRIDPEQQGVFSSRIITGLLRQRLGFEGVVIADDLGAAVAVKEVSPGERAVRFLQAGGDLVITADPELAAPMAKAILARAEQDQAFAAELTRKAERVLALKASVSR